MLHQAIVDVQYDRGFVFLDKCGSLLLSLQDALGTPFVGDVKTMEHAELRNAAERIGVTYGSKNFNVTQSWIENPVRVEHLAPIGWDVVSETLGVKRHVQRVGVRFVYFWRIDSLEEGHAALAQSELVRASSAWANVLAQPPRTICWTLVLDDPRGRMRVSTDVAEVAVEGILAHDLVDVVPKHAIVFDVDHTYPGKGPYSLNKGELKDFIRMAWQRTKSAATLLGEHIGVDGAE